MIAVRCDGCGKLLGYFDGKGEVKCPRSGCGKKTVFDTMKMRADPIKKKKYADLKQRQTSSGITYW